MSITSTPVGDIEQLETLIISTIFNSDSELKISHTLGNHIDNVWISIPYYGLTKNVSIVNNKIYTDLDN